VPDTGGRSYLVSTLDMWTEVFSSIGSRTTGTRAGPRCAGLASTRRIVRDAATRGSASTPADHGSRSETPRRSTTWP